MAQLNQNLNLSTYRMKKMKKGVAAPGKAGPNPLPQLLRKKPSNLPSVTSPIGIPNLSLAKPMQAAVMPKTVGAPLPSKPKGMGSPGTPMGIMGGGMPRIPKGG